MGTKVRTTWIFTAMYKEIQWFCFKHFFLNTNMFTLLHQKAMSKHLHMHIYVYGYTVCTFVYGYICITFCICVWTLYNFACWKEKALHFKTDEASSCILLVTVGLPGERRQTLHTLHTIVLHPHPTEKNKTKQNWCPMTPVNLALLILIESGLCETLTLRDHSAPRREAQRERERVRVAWRKLLCSLPSHPLSGPLSSVMSVCLQTCRQDTLC